MMSSNRRVFVGVVHYTVGKGARQTTVLLRARMEAERQTVGTEETPFETWLITVSRELEGRVGFGTQGTELDRTIAHPGQMHMLASQENWFNAFGQLAIPPKYLAELLQVCKASLRTKTGRYEIGQIWENRSDIRVASVLCWPR